MPIKAISKVKAFIKIILFLIITRQVIYFMNAKILNYFILARFY